jgi:anti-anti-sigma factor
VAAELDLTISKDASGAYRVTASGEFDATNRGSFLDCARLALDDPACAALRVDLSGITFMDCSGMGALINISSECRARAITPTLYSSAPAVTRILTICGLDHELPLAGAVT